MKKVWINPAFKDQVTIKPEEKKEEKKPIIIIKEQPEQKPEQKLEKKEKKPDKKEKKEKLGGKKEKKVDDKPLQLTEPVMENLKEKGINTEKLTDLLNKDFTKNGFKEELKNRAFSDEDINHIISCIKGRMSTPAPKPTPPDNIEHKLFQYLMEKEIPIEVKFLTGITFTGKIKFFSEWLINLEVKGKGKEKSKNVILNRLMVVCYYQLEENSPSEAELKQLPPVDVSGVEVKVLQQYKDKKTTLLVHLQGGLQVKGTLEWYEKLVYHLKSLDGKTHHTVYRNIVLYIEEVE